MSETTQIIMAGTAIAMLFLAVLELQAIATHLRGIAIDINEIRRRTPMQ